MSPRARSPTGEKRLTLLCEIEYLRSCRYRPFASSRSLFPSRFHPSREFPRARFTRSSEPTLARSPRQHTHTHTHTQRVSSSCVVVVGGVGSERALYSQNRYGSPRPANIGNVPFYIYKPLLVSISLGSFALSVHNFSRAILSFNYDTSRNTQLPTGNSRSPSRHRFVSPARSSRASAPFPRHPLNPKYYRRPIDRPISYTKHP